MAVMGERLSDDYVLLLTKSQPTLYALIVSLVSDRVAAQDILQEVNLTLWRKAKDFEPGTNFIAWAGQIARYQVMNYRRRMGRERLIFDETLFDLICERQVETQGDCDRFADALRQCLDRMKAEHRELLAERYAAGGSVASIARSRGKQAGAISQLLYRLRGVLLDCVQRRLAEADGT